MPGLLRVPSWLIDSGLLDIAGGDLIGVVVETGCRYAASLCFPASVDVGLAVSRIGTSSVRYDVGVFGEDEEAPAAEGFFVHVHVDRQSRRPKAPPPGWRVAFESIMR